ncbi:hypothetical protein ACFFTN_17925 [Aminobacter aganoensis]|uniref:Uncharacterized protein n=1 Tax=Aminobacter aganoensis TaxID=83264 RepID=A0A7X0F4G7_9HYPH|nr:MULTISPECIES: hypothetical protein [Aminobacter]MBB6352880.1 hypothetical protein [Aminobacter aganoensis]
MAQTQYLSNGRAAQAAASTARPAAFARFGSYLVFAVSFGFTAAVVVGLVH